MDDPQDISREVAGISVRGGIFYKLCYWDEVRELFRVTKEMG